MTKFEFISAVAEKTGFSKKETDTMLKAMIETVTETVANGETVQFVGFGTFEPVERAARTGINPQTKDKIKIPARIVPHFKAGQCFKDAVASKKRKKTRK